MNVVGYGGGTDSTAMLVGLWRHHVPVDLILFADPGAEQPHTYALARELSECQNLTDWIIKSQTENEGAQVSMACTQN